MTPIWDPDLGPPIWTLIWTSIWDTPIWDPNLGYEMNEIILAPCDVISKIKQNSSDMNEIILAPCDAGYVQSCTGFT
jgi:hypothetical protein